MEHADLVVEAGVRYGVADGQELLLDVLRLPGGDRPRPAVVVIHGGFLFKGARGDLAQIAVPLARAGYVIFDIDYRLFVMATGANRWPAQLDDAQRAVRWVRAHAAQYGVDPGQIGALGFSAGGQLATFLGSREGRVSDDPALASYSSRVQAVVNLAGDVDMSVPFLAEEIIELMPAILGGSLSNPPPPEAWRDFSAITFVDGDTASCLLVHGALDVRVPVENSRRLAARLHEVGVEAVYAEYPRIDHFGVTDWNLAGPLIVPFLDRHLGGEEAVGSS
jgi:acetyl esterase/lipase